MKNKSNKFSLRESLIGFGVVDEKCIQWHLANAMELLSKCPNMDITRYRPNPNALDKIGNGSVYQG